MKRYLGIDVSQQQCALGVVVDTVRAIVANVEDVGEIAHESGLLSI